MISRTPSLSSLLLPLLYGVLLVQRVHSFVAPLEIKAYKFFDSSSGESVDIKGVDYYPRPNAGEWNINNVDFFNEDFRHVWTKDIPYLESLGVNAVRLYAVDPGKNHTGFMCALAKAGIYAIVGLSASCANCSITPDSAPNCYPPGLKTRGQLIIGSFAMYDNVLGFDAGNEVDLTTNMQPWINAPCQKKFLRDMRAYMADCPLRQVPVGVVLADIQRVEKAHYYNCFSTAEEDPYEVASWIGINSYQNCDASVTDLQNSAGYQAIISDFNNYSIPLMLTEYGCLNPTFPTVDGYQAQRTFNDAAWMFEPGMVDTLAGGFVFEYATELQNAIVPYPFTNYSAGNYGLGFYSPEDCDHDTINCTYNPKPEFSSLQEQYGATQTVGTYTIDTFTASSERMLQSPCPTNYLGLDDFTWEADSETDLHCPGVSLFTCPGAPIFHLAISNNTTSLDNSTNSSSNASYEYEDQTSFPTPAFLTRPPVTVNVRASTKSGYYARDTIISSTLAASLLSLYIIMS